MFYDWRRTRFTLDAATVARCSAFVSLLRAGLDLSRHRVVQWCTECQTTVSDLEVLHKEVPSSLVRTCATRRRMGKGRSSSRRRGRRQCLENAVAVHPEDERYRGWWAGS